MFDRIDGFSPFVVSKVEPAQKNNLKNQQNNGQSLYDERRKLNIQKTFLEVLQDATENHETLEKELDGQQLKKKRK